jgi:hypothetical protein
LVGAAGLLLATSVACGSVVERAQPGDLARPMGPKPADDDAGIAPPPPEACGEFCGATFLHEVTAPPNLYFLVDRSGSMGAFAEGASLTKYDMARKVLGDLLTVIGHRVRYGASIFPADTRTCGGGHEVFPPTLGNLPGCDGSYDPQLVDFLRTFGNFAPGGSTPTAAALSDLRPELQGLEGDTFLVLLTDGAPNCNLDATCGSDQCTLNIEGVSVARRECTPDFNCCDADNTGTGAPAYCVDADATEHQVLRLAAHGIPTYVVGMPGAEPYSDLLSRLAVAGGTARDGALAYYAVKDQDELEQALYAIGTGLAISCSITLDAPPDDPDMVNVYFDGTLIVADPDDGWSWDGESNIQVNGEACDRLKSGSVIDARAVFGCDTVVR